MQGSDWASASEQTRVQGVARGDLIRGAHAPGGWFLDPLSQVGIAEASLAGNRGWSKGDTHRALRYGAAILSLHPQPSG